MTIDEMGKLLIGPMGGFALSLFVMQFLFKQLNKEREARIVLLEQQSARCADDRIQLHKVVNDLQAENRHIYKEMLSFSRGAEPNRDGITP
jgi:hypothetical protein